VLSTRFGIEDWDVVADAGAGRAWVFASPEERHVVVGCPAREKPMQLRLCGAGPGSAQGFRV
jgi:hypothetical protein